MTRHRNNVLSLPKVLGATVLSLALLGAGAVEAIDYSRVQPTIDRVSFVADFARRCHANLSAYGSAGLPTEPCVELELRWRPVIDELKRLQPEFTKFGDEVDQVNSREGERVINVLVQDVNTILKTTNYIKFLTGH